MQGIFTNMNECLRDKTQLTMTSWLPETGTLLNFLYTKKHFVY